MTYFSSRLRASVCMTALCFALSACGTASTNSDGKPQTSVTQNKPTPDNIYGERRESLSSIRSLYEDDKANALIAARYAKALRESGDLKQATAVLTPLMKQKSTPTLALTEMAAVELETADFVNAENFARRGIKIDNKNFRAWHVLGIALDAQGKHMDAQASFQKALDLWQGDKVPVMNNLALNLAAQGYTDKALDMLYKAQKEDPDRVEIERNIRIIRTLNEPAEYGREIKTKSKTSQSTDAAKTTEPVKTDAVKTETKPAAKSNVKPKPNSNAAANTAAQKVE